MLRLQKNDLSLDILHLDFRVCNSLVNLCPFEGHRRVVRTQTRDYIRPPHFFEDGTYQETPDLIKHHNHIIFILKLC
jgi:hypothetical protein